LPWCHGGWCNCVNPHEGKANPVQCQLVYHISDSNQAVVFYQILHESDHNDFFVWKDGNVNEKPSWMGHTCSKSTLEIDKSKPQELSL
jgi:hypothetical protein